MSFKQLLLYASIAAFSMGSMHASEKFMAGSFAHFNAPNLQEHFGANQQFVPVMMVPANMMNLGQMAQRPSWSITNHLTFNNAKNIAVIGAICGAGYFAYNYLYGKDLAAIKGMLHKATESTKGFISAKFDDFKNWVTKNVTNRIDDVSKDVKKVESKVDTANNRLDTVATQQNTLDGKIGAVESKVDAVNTRLDTVATQQNTVVQAQERLEAGQSRLEKAQTQLRDEMEAKFVSLLEAFKKLATSTEENGTKTITENKLAIEEAKKQILTEITALIQKTNGENTALLLAQFKILIEQINGKKQE